MVEDKPPYEARKGKERGSSATPRTFHLEWPLLFSPTGNRSLRARSQSTLRPVIEFPRTYGVHMYAGEFSAIRWAPDAILRSMRGWTGQRRFAFINLHASANILTRDAPTACELLVVNTELAMKTVRSGRLPVAGINLSDHLRWAKRVDGARLGTRGCHALACLKEGS